MMRTIVSVALLLMTANSEWIRTDENVVENQDFVLRFRLKAKDPFALEKALRFASEPYEFFISNSHSHLFNELEIHTRFMYAYNYPLLSNYAHSHNARTTGDLPDSESIFQERRLRNWYDRTLIYKKRKMLSQACSLIPSLRSRFIRNTWWYRTFPSRTCLASFRT